MDPARAERDLQREVLFRARRLIFSDLADLGGPPTLHEERRQLLADDSAARLMLPVLHDGIATAGGPELLVAAFGEAREQWERRVPGLLAFGNRTHSELAALAPRSSTCDAPASASALFQVAASLLDWIGDETAEGGTLAAALPAVDFHRFCHDSRARGEVSCRLHRGAPPATIAFAAIVRAALELADKSGHDATRFHDALAEAYEAELESFEPIASPERRLTAAWDKFIAPTAVIGELAQLSVIDDPSAVVAAAAHAIAPVFGRIDDVADLCDDLNAGALNTISAAAGCPSTESCGVAEVLREILGAGLIEDAASAVTHDVRLLERIMSEADVDPARRTLAHEWLRTTIWRWLS